MLYGYKTENTCAQISLLLLKEKHIISSNRLDEGT